MPTPSRSCGTMPDSSLGARALRVPLRHRASCSRASRCASRGLTLSAPSSPASTVARDLLPPRGGLTPALVSHSTASSAGALARAGSRRRGRGSASPIDLALLRTDASRSLTNRGALPSSSPPSRLTSSSTLTTAHRVFYRRRARSSELRGRARPQRRAWPGRWLILLVAQILQLLLLSTPRSLRLSLISTTDPSPPSPRACSTWSPSLSSPHSLRPSRSPPPRRRALSSSVPTRRLARRARPSTSSSRAARTRLRARVRPPSFVSLDTAWA